MSIKVHVITEPIILFKAFVMNTVFISYTEHSVHYECIFIHNLLQKEKYIVETVAAINQSKKKVLHEV